MTPDHVIFGNGPVGRATMHALVSRGQAVRMINRSGRGSVPDRVEVVCGDAMNPEFTRSVGGSKGGLPDPERVLLSLGPGLPRPPGERAGGGGDQRCPVREHRQPAVASPRLSATPPVLAGKSVSVIGNPDRLHSYTFIPDIGEGLATLALTAEAEGEVWHLPNDPHPQTTRQMIQTAYRLAGTTGRLGGIPTVALRLLGLANRTIREVLEMAYEFRDDFVVDSTKIARLGVTATPIDEAIERTLASYRR